MSDAGVEDRQLTKPQFKEYLPTHIAVDPGYTELQRENEKVRYIKEQLDSESPFLSNLVRERPGLLLGIILPDNTIVYSENAQAHSHLWRAETDSDSLTDSEGAQMEIDWGNSRPSISIYGNKDLIDKALDFLKKSGYPEDSSIEGAVRREGESGMPDLFKGSLGEGYKVNPRKMTKKT